MTSPPALELLARLQASVLEVGSRDREVVRIGPFTALLDPVRALKYLSFALPGPGTTATVAGPALGALIEAFARRDRAARIELFTELCPEVEPLLRDRGWVLSERMPVMICAGDDLPRGTESTPEVDSVAHREAATKERAPAPAGVEVVEIGDGTDDETLRAYVAAIRAAFDDPEPVTEEHLARRRGRGGWTAVAAMADGEVVGTAECTPPALGVVEVIAVTTRPDFRRRGIAGALTAEAARRAFAAGAQLAWLTAANEGAARIYGRAGFAVRGEQVAYDAPAAQAQQP